MLLENYSLTMAACKEGPCKDGSCAIVELSDNINPVLPYLGKVVKSCTYNPEANILSFRRKGLDVTLYTRLIVILNVKDEAAAKEMIAWLKDKISSAEENFEPAKR